MGRRGLSRNAKTARGRSRLQRDGSVEPILGRIIRVPSTLGHGLADNALKYALPQAHGGSPHLVLLPLLLPRRHHHVLHVRSHGRRFSLGESLRQSDESVAGRGRKSTCVVVWWRESESPRVRLRRSCEARENATVGSIVNDKAIREAAGRKTVKAGQRGK